MRREVQSGSPSAEKERGKIGFKEICRLREEREGREGGREGRENQRGSEGETVKKRKVEEGKLVIC